MNGKSKGPIILVAALAVVLAGVLLFVLCGPGPGG